MVASIKVNDRLIQKIFCESYDYEEIGSYKIHRFYEKGKMIANVILDEYDVLVEVIIDESNMG